MRARFLGKDPESNVGDSPTLFATDRTDRSTFIAQGWKVTDPQVLADVGPIPHVSHERAESEVDRYRQENKTKHPARELARQESDDYQCRSGAITKKPCTHDGEEWKQ